MSGFWDSICDIFVLHGKECFGVKRMAYPDEKVVQTWMDALSGLNVHRKKMFGCYCVYCDHEPVGWLSENGFSLREVGLPYLPRNLKRPSPGDACQEIVIPLDDCNSEWLPRAVQDTAAIRKAKKNSDLGER